MIGKISVKGVIRLCSSYATFMEWRIVIIAIEDESKNNGIRVGGVFKGKLDLREKASRTRGFERES